MPAAAAKPAPPTTQAVPPERHSVSVKEKHQAENVYLEGARAVEKKDLEAAFEDFRKAELLDPANQDYVTAAQIARANLVTQLIGESDKAQTLNRPEEARAKLMEASTLAPDNPSVLQHLDPGRGMELLREDDPDSVQLAPTVALQPANGRHSFHMHGTGQEILKQVLSAYGITPTIDPSVEVKRTSFDGDDVTYQEAARMLQMATDSFFVPLDPVRVLVAKDTKPNREQFMREVLETVYLPGLTPTEMTDMGTLARNLFDAQQSTVQQGTNTLTVRAPQVKLTALNRTLADLLDGRSQIDLEIRLIELDDSRTRNIGVQAPQQFTAFNVDSELNSVINGNSSLVQQIVSSGLAPAGDLAAIAAVLIASGQVSSSVLTQAFATFGNGLTLTGVTLPSVTANFALNASNTHMLEDVHLRLQDQDKGNLKIGEKYPIQTSSYSGLTGTSVSIPGISTAGLSSELAALGLSGASATQQAIPQVQYQDIGLELNITPRVLRSNDVNLDFDMKLEALAGSTLNNIPELTNRQFTMTTTAKQGQSAVFFSDLTKQEATAVSGVPGVSDLPGFGQATDQNRNVTTSTLLVIITPRILRREHTEIAGPAIVLPRHE
jgi:general secretion pathway protein D